MSRAAARHTWRAGADKKPRDIILTAGATPSPMEAESHACLRRAISGFLLWTFFASLLFFSLQGAGQFSALIPGVSLRYDTSITEAGAMAARQYAIQNSERLGVWPSFWAEETTEAVSELHTAELKTLRYSGEAGDVYPAQYLLGSAPGFLDEGGCALSEAASHRLFGSTDVLGQEVKVGENRYTVRGVFKGESPLLLLSEGMCTPLTGWQAAELSGVPKDNAKAQATSFSQSAGLGAPAAVLSGASLSSLSTAAALAPPVFCLLFAFILLLAALRPMKTARGQILLFSGLLLFALALPLLLGLLPPSLLPSRWSDFTYWAGLWQRCKEGLTAFFAMRPGSRDVLLKTALLKQALLFVALVPASALLCRRLLAVGGLTGQTPPPS